MKIDYNNTVAYREVRSKLVIPESIGEIWAVLNNFKPGYLIAEGDEQFINELIENSVELELVKIKKFLVNKVVLREKLNNEKELAVKIGWDFEKSIEGNILWADIEPDNRIDLKAQLLAGFVFGFPESALNYWSDMIEVRNLKKVFKIEFYMQSNLWNKKKDMDDNDFYKIKMIRRRYQQIEDPKNNISEELQNYYKYELKTEFAKFWRRFYLKYFNLNVFESELFIYRKQKIIYNKFGHPCYEFAINGKESLSDDVKMLENRIVEFEGFKLSSH